MSGVLYPDFLGTLSKAAAFESNRAQTDYLNEDRAAKAEIAPLIPKALQGDKEALNQIGTRHPDTFTKLLPMLERMDAATRTRAKEATEWTTRAAMGVLSLPENERPAAYQAALADGKRLGYQIDMPPQYDRAVEDRLRMVINQAGTISDFLKRQTETPQAMPPLDGGGAAPPSAGGGVNPNNIGNVRPAGGGPSAGFQQPASLDDGIRLAVNNVKAYPAKFNGGQPMTLLQIGERWAPKGDGANDPRQWAINVASIGGLDPNKPLDMNDPMTAAAFARGVHGAEHGANKVLPPERYAQAITGGAQPPGIAQGDAAPRADASGNPLPPPQQNAREILTIRQFVHSQIPGASPLTVNGFPAYDKNGRLGIQLPNGQRDFIDVPKPKEPGADKGLFGDSLTGRALTALRTLTPESQEYAAAYAILSKPQVVPDGTGGFTTIQPMNLSMFAKPTFAGGAFVEPSPAGGPAPTQVGGVTVQNIPGKGKPLDNSARDELTKASGGVLELTELVKSFDPTFGGFMFGPLGEADNLRKRNMPDALGGKDEKGQAQWWQRYQQFANLERNKLFGAALTPGEAAEFNKAMINPGMKPDQITANLARQRDIAAKALSRIVNSMVAGGYNPQAIEAATGIAVGDLPSAMGGVPQAGPPTAAPPPAPAPAPQQQPAPQTPSPAERGRSQFDLKKKYGLE